MLSPVGSLGRPPWVADIWAKLWKGKDQSHGEGKCFPDRSSTRKYKWPQVMGLLSERVESQCGKSRINKKNNRTYFSGLFYRRPTPFLNSTTKLKGGKQRKCIGHYYNIHYRAVLGVGTWDLLYFL